MKGNFRGMYKIELKLQLRWVLIFGWVLLMVTKDDNMSTFPCDNTIYDMPQYITTQAAMPPKDLLELARGGRDSSKSK